jgi:glycosyltransferase involved in cell wall biosynthesis
MITIALLTYNRPQYLRHAIEGVLNQKYKNFELLICDNGSDIETQKIINSFVDYRIKVIRNDYNNIEFYNHPFKIDTREFLLITHDDDIMADDYLEIMLSEIVNTEFSAIACNCEIINKDSLGSGKELLNLKSEKIIIKDNYIKHYFAREVPPCPTVILRKKFFTDNKIKMNFNVENNGSILILNKVLYKYRIHNSQDSNIYKNIMEIELFDAWLKKIKFSHKHEILKILYTVYDIFNDNPNEIIKKKCLKIFNDVKYFYGLPSSFFIKLKILGLKKYILNYE